MGFLHLRNLFSDRLHTLPLLVLYLTDGCNSRCVTCDIWRSPRRNMSAELVDMIASASAELGVRWVLLSGGEAMQHPQWPQIAQRFKREGAYVMLLTNGLLLKKQADDLLNCIDEVIVSLDGGTSATYAAIRGVDAFELVLEGIQAAQARGLPVATRTTVQRANFREIPQIIAAAKASGASRISFLTVDVSSIHAFGPRFESGSDHQMTTAALTPDDITELRRILDETILDFAPDFAAGLIAESPAKLRRMADYFAALHGSGDFPRPRCNAPHTSVVIEADGRLRPCYFLPEMGKLHLESGAGSLPEALNSDVALALRHAYRTGQRAECERCVCPLYKGPRALLRV
jgi:radical SAM protein with 4Fe4S-binding SPASM domain